VEVTYQGIHLYTVGDPPKLLATFEYLDTLVSWLALNDMLTLAVVHKRTMRSAKLHILSREAAHIKMLLSRYADAVLAELQKQDKEKALRRKVEQANKLAA
jgi:hypothetical protein